MCRKVRRANRCLYFLLRQLFHSAAALQLRRAAALHRREKYETAKLAVRAYWRAEA